MQRTNHTRNDFGSGEDRAESDSVFLGGTRWVRWLLEGHGPEAAESLRRLTESSFRNPGVCHAFQSFALGFYAFIRDLPAVLPLVSLKC